MIVELKLSDFRSVAGGISILSLPAGVVAAAAAAAKDLTNKAAEQSSVEAG